MARSTTIRSGVMVAIGGVLAAVVLWLSAYHEEALHDWLRPVASAVDRLPRPPVPRPDPRKHYGALRRAASLPVPARETPTGASESPPTGSP